MSKSRIRKVCNLREGILSDRQIEERVKEVKKIRKAKMKNLNKKNKWSVTFYVKGGGWFDRNTRHLTGALWFALLNMGKVKEIQRIRTLPDSSFEFEFRPKTTQSDRRALRNFTKDLNK